MTTGRRRRSACRSRWGPTRASDSRLMPAPVHASPSSRSGCSIRMAGGSVERRKTRPCRNLPSRSCPTRSLILTMGRPQGVETIKDLPGFKVAARGPARSQHRRREIVTARIDPQTGSMPGRWYGYDAARAVVIDTADRETIVGARRACAVSRWSTGSRGAAISSSRSVPTGRPCATASWRRSCRDCPAGKRRCARSRHSIPSRARTSRSRRPARQPVMVTKLEEAGGARRDGLEHDVQHAAGRAGRARVRQGDPDRARRRPKAVFRLGLTGRCSGCGPST